MRCSILPVYAVLICLGSLPTYAQPKLTVVGGTAIDFGDIYYSKKVSREIQILNSGSQTLAITDIETFCSCTKAKISSKSIAPGTNAVLTLTFDPKVFQGKISKAIRVKSNDGSSSATPIMFTAKVYKLLEVTPDYVFFGVFPADSTATKTMKLKNVSPGTLKILRLTAKDRYINAKVKDTVLEPGKETDLIVTASPQQPVTIKGQLEIATDSEVDKKIKVEYTGLSVQKTK